MFASLCCFLTSALGPVGTSIGCRVACPFVCSFFSVVEAGRWLGSCPILETQHKGTTASLVSPRRLPLACHCARVHERELDFCFVIHPSLHSTPSSTGKIPFDCVRFFNLFTKSPLWWRIIRRSFFIWGCAPCSEPVGISQYEETSLGTTSTVLPYYLYADRWNVPTFSQCATHHGICGFCTIIITRATGWMSRTKTVRLCSLTLYSKSIYVPSFPPSCVLVACFCTKNSHTTFWIVLGSIPYLVDDG